LKKYKFSNRELLKSRIDNILSNIKKQTLKNLIDSMNSRFN
jgi:hypothetical protein